MYLVSWFPSVIALWIALPFEEILELFSPSMTSVAPYLLHFIFRFSQDKVRRWPGVVNYSRPPPDLILGEAEYEVEQIRSHRRHGRRKQLQYLLKWKGYPESDNTWEPADQVHAPD